jgi:hypothetical protein
MSNRSNDGLGVFKDGRSALAGTGGGHSIPRYANLDGNRVGDGAPNLSTG